MGSIGRTVVEDTGYRMGGLYNNNEIDREEAKIKARVEELDKDFNFTKTVNKNAVGKVLSTDYTLDLGDNYSIKIKEKKVGKSTIITGSVNVPPTSSAFKSDTIYRGDFKTVGEAKTELKKRLKKYLLG